MADAAPQIIPGAVRTATPIIVGQAVAQAAEWGFDIDPKNKALNVLAFVAAIVWYAVLRWRETTGATWATRLLGAGTASKPHFSEKQPRKPRARKRAKPKDE
jgi:hypothetical protein